MVDGKIETEEEEEEEQGEKLEGRGGAENEGKEKKKKGERRGGMLLTWRASTKHAVTVQWGAAPRGERGAPARGETPRECGGLSLSRPDPIKDPIEAGNLAFRGSRRETAYTFGINVTGWTVKICVRSLIGWQYGVPATSPLPT